MEKLSPTHCVHSSNTEWKILQRPNPKNPLKTYYSFTYSKECGYKLALKLSLEGINFIVPQNTKIEIVTEQGRSLWLTTDYKERSCKGCGSINKEDDKPGVTLHCKLSNSDIHFFDNQYPEHIRIYLPEVAYGGRINVRSSEIFREQLTIASKFQQNDN